jgi:5-methylcytosine-specific restriction endonuclease McrA
MTRRRLSPKARAQIFTDAKGLCHICGGKIFKTWEVEHVIPLALGGADEPSNMKPAHPVCHKAKTKIDVASTAKAKRLERRQMGIKKRTGFWKPKGARYDWTAGKWIVERNTP